MSVSSRTQQNSIALAKQARIAHSREYWGTAADLYRKAADLTDGFPRDVNHRCAADCDAQKQFTGFIHGVM